MKLGMVGLGRMGSGMTERLRRDGHEVMTYDPQVESTASSLEELAAQLEPPRVVWMMIPAGEITEQTAQRAARDPRERRRRSSTAGTRTSTTRSAANAEAAEKGIDFLDVGVSGGIWGLKEGFCLMAGGSDKGVALLQPALETLAPQDGWAHVGPSGAGHFVKMVHNGDRVRPHAGLRRGVRDHARVASSTSISSRSPASGATGRSFAPGCSSCCTTRSPSTATTSTTSPATSRTPARGAGLSRRRSTRPCPLPVITAALFARFASRQDESFAAKVDAALREQFGGHAVKKKQ